MQLAADLELSWAVPIDVENGYVVDLCLSAKSNDGPSYDVLIQADMPQGFALGAPAMDEGWELTDGKLRNAIGDVPSGETVVVGLPLYGVGLVEDEVVDLLADAIVGEEDTDPSNNRVEAQMKVRSARRFDVDDNGGVYPSDVLAIINDINRNGSRALPAPIPSDFVPPTDPPPTDPPPTDPPPTDPPPTDPPTPAFTVETASQPVNQNVGERVQEDVHLGTPRFVHSEMDPLAVDAAFTIGWSNVTYPPRDDDVMEPTFITETTVVEVATGNTVSVEPVGDTEKVSDVRIEQGYVAHLGAILSGAEYNVLVDFSAGAYRGDEVDLTVEGVQFNTVEVVADPPPQVDPPSPPPPPTPPTTMFVIQEGSPSETVVAPGDIEVVAIVGETYSLPDDSLWTGLTVSASVGTTDAIGFGWWMADTDGDGAFEAITDPVQPVNGVLTFQAPVAGGLNVTQDVVPWRIELDILAEPMNMGQPFRLAVDSLLAELAEDGSVIDIDFDDSELQTLLRVED